MGRLLGKMAVFALVFFLSFSFIFSFNGSVANGNVINHQQSELTIINPLLSSAPFNNSLSGETGDHKEVPAYIKEIYMNSAINGIAFPNTTVEFIVSCVTIAPEIVTLFPNVDRMNYNLTYYFNNNTFKQSLISKESLILNFESSYGYYNTTKKTWDIVFSLIFSWSYEGNKYYDIAAHLIDIYGGMTHKIKYSVYYFEKDLIISGEPQLSMNNPGYLTPDLYVKGGEFLLVEGLSVYFEGVPQVSPDPNDVSIGIIDDSQRIWEYKPVLRQQINKISFSFPLPKYDGKLGFAFKILSAPSSIAITGEASFLLTIDSSAPTIGEFNFIKSDNSSEFTWTILDLGSGFKVESFCYSIKDIEGRIVKEWTYPTEIVFQENRINIIEKDSLFGDYYIIVSYSDKVLNEPFEIPTYFFSTLSKPLHDLALSENIEITPNPVIVNQEIYFWSTIENLGTVEENDIYVVIINDDILLEELWIDQIPAGSKRDIRWDWMATGGTHSLSIFVDPNRILDDENYENNDMTVSFETEYLDLTMNDDYIIVSDTSAKQPEKITLTFLIWSIGSIDCAPSKALFYQDGCLLGTSQIPALKPESIFEMELDWCVDSSVRNFTVYLDPYNEVLESVEDNNLIVFPNPFFYEKKNETTIPGYENNENDGDDEVQEISDTTIIPVENSGTEWKGPEEASEAVEDDDDGIPLVIVDPVPDNRIDVLPIIIPTGATLISFSIFGAAFFAYKMESIRYKLLLLIIPLYSKLKKKKIEEGVRFEILGYLKARPGANYSELKRNLDLNDGSLVHHLRVLEREEKIYSKKLGKYKLFYIFSYRREIASDDYISPLHKRILEIISQNPGIVPNKLSKILDRSQTDMSYHLSELSRNGFLYKKKKGRNIHYYVDEDTSNIMA